MSGLSQNTKNLTIRQLQKLIANNGLAENYEKAKAQKRPTEYCLTALNESLAEKLAKSHDKYLRSTDSVTSEINAMMQSSSILPPFAPKNFKSKQIIESNFSSDDLKPASKPKTFSFNFGGPLWQVEKLTLDQRINIFTKGA